MDFSVQRAPIVQLFHCIVDHLGEGRNHCRVIQDALHLLQIKYNTVHPYRTTLQYLMVVSSVLVAVIDVGRQSFDSICLWHFIMLDYSSENLIFLVLGVGTLI